MTNFSTFIKIPLSWDLARHKHFSIVFNWGKWATASKDGTSLPNANRQRTRKNEKSHYSSIGSWIFYAKLLVVSSHHLGPRISFFSSTFWLRCRVGKGKNNRFLPALSYKTQIQLTSASNCILDWWIGSKITSLLEAIASTTSRVKVFPCPDVPINTVGLICWKKTLKCEKFETSALSEYVCGKIGDTVCTLTASKSSLTGSCSWAHGFLKCWSDSLRDLTIKPCKKKKKKITRLI